METATQFCQYGGRVLFIDEIRKYHNWSRELELIYDGFRDMKTVFTSSSALEIFRGESDLFRRVLSYTLPGLSFREYLELAAKETFPAITIEKLLNRHVD